MKFSDNAVGKLDNLRFWLDRPIVINSGYRCPKHNDEVSSTGLDGPHTVVDDDNITVDIRISDEDAHGLLKVIDYEVFTGVGIKQNGPHSSRFIHLDCLDEGPRPNVWSY